MTSDRIRARTLILASASCALTILAAAVWIGHGEGGEEHAALVSSPSALMEPGFLSAPLAADPSRVDLSRKVAVVSRAGLPIQSILLAGSDGAWSSRKLEDGRLDRAELLGAVNVCAPGHLARSVDGKAATIALDVDAMLVIHIAGLRACLTDAKPVRDLPGGRAGCAGFLDDDSFGCAVARELLPAGSSEQKGVAFDLHWNGRLTTRVRFRPEQAGVVDWRTTCPTAPPSSDLVMQVLRRGDAEHCGFKVSGRVEPRPGSSSSNGGSGPGSSRLEAAVDFAWGDIRTSWKGYDLTQVVRRDQEELSFSDLPLGACVSLVARDARTNAWGCFECTHDGSAHELELRPALVLRGTVSPPQSGPAPERLSIEWLQRFREVERPAWTTSPGASVRTEGRSWSITGPSRIRVGSAMSSLVPPLCEVRITSPGFLPTTVNATVTDGRVIELLDVKLEPLEPDFWIRTLSNKGLCDLGHGARIDVQDRAGRIDVLRVARAWRQEDGRVAVCCRRIDRRDGAPRRDPIAPIVSGAVRLLTTPKWHDLRQFTLGDAMTFDEQESLEYQLEFVPPKGPDRMRVRLVWNGVECDPILLTSSHNDFIPVTWRVPAGPVRVEWKCSESRSEWKSQAVSSLHQRFDGFECPQEDSQQIAPPR